MQIEIVNTDGSIVVEASEDQTVLSVLQNHGIHLNAMCGGAGVCGKCKVLLRTEEGLGYHLACQCNVSQGMKIIIEQDNVMSISESGFSAPYEIDKGADGEYGLAIDIGTTTVVCHLHSLADGKRLASASCPNPQIVFGGDVISRITASMNGKLPQLTDAILTGLAKLKAQACASAGIEGIELVKAVIAGNTVMQHIAAGLSPDSIGVNPFIPESLFGDEHNINDVCANTYMMPCVAGYVGGDITAGIVATGLNRKEKPCLMVDVGTNGEMVLGDKNGMISCATAAGPAFEGANIECGMPAGPGGISKVKIKDGELLLDVIGDIEPIGICGSGLIDILAIMLELGVIDETGLILDQDDVDPSLAQYIDEINGDNVIYLSRKNNVYITQKDVRNIQLAKAAICAGIYTLLDEQQISVDDVEALYVAGGFGSHIDIANAMRIGIFPAELIDRTESVGNSAGEGATNVLISAQAREELLQIMDKCGYIELSTSARFNEHYVEQMMFEE